MRNTLLYISGNYLNVAAIDPNLPTGLRRSCEYVARALDWLCGVSFSAEAQEIMAN